MGLFDEMKEYMQTGGAYETKTVVAKNSEVGRKKMETIAEMRNRGYVLVNEVAQQGYIDSLLGPVAATSYTLTFQRDPELLKQIQKEAEERRLQLEAERKELEAQLKKEREEREQQGKLCDRIVKELESKVGNGYCVLINGAKENIKPAARAIKKIFDEMKGYPFKKGEKAMVKILKKAGFYCALPDCGKDVCDNFAKYLTKLGVKVSVVGYDASQYTLQDKKLKKLYTERDGFAALLYDAIFRIGLERSEGKLDYKHPFYSLLVEEY